MNKLNANLIFDNFLKIVTGIGIFLAFAFILSPFLIPILLGGILAMAFSPSVEYFLRKGWGRRTSVLIITLGFFVLGLAPSMVVLMRGTKVVTRFLGEQSFIETKNKIVTKAYIFIEHFSKLNDIDPIEAHKKFDNFINSASLSVLTFLSKILGQIPNVVMLIFITILAFYFFLIDEIRIRKWFDSYFNFTKINGDKFISLVKSICKEVFLSNVITGAVQAIVVALGAFFCKTGDVFIILFCTFFLSFIPVIGASPVAFVVAGIAFIDGRIGAGIGMSVVGLVAGVSDNLIRQYLISRGEVEVPVFISFLSIIGGVLMLGLPGLFLGPLLASLTYGALPIIFDEYYHKK
jgi:predicted PurR-regulated permease PerM